MELITGKYKEKIAFTLGCYDRIIINGIMPEISYSQGMTSFLYKQGVRIFDYAKFMEPFKEKVRVNAEKIASENGLEIEFIRNKGVRKEAVISSKIEKRGGQPGLVHILSAMETCPTYKAWFNKQTQKAYVRPDQSKCLHYYFYFIDPWLGLCYVRVPTWSPFKLQVYINGHNILANELTAAQIPFSMLDNAFEDIGDINKAQELADNIDIKKIHKYLDEFAWRFSPVFKEFGLRYHWSIMQAEYATDIVFKQQQDLQGIYSELVATAIHTVKPENIATFLGKKLDPKYQGEMGNNYNVRLEGSRIKHSMGKNSIKMYDKFSKILRIETTTNDISFFKHYREVVHRDGSTSMENASLKKGLYSLGMLKDNLNAANKRYIEFISAFDNKEVGRKRLEKVTHKKQENKRNYKGFNFFDHADMALLMQILKGEFNIAGFQNKHLQTSTGLNSGQVSRILKRLRVHGIIKKVGKTYKYYLTKLGKQTIIMAEKLKELVLVPAYAY
jgi:predicted transcriptional regulator